jgi:hypothetical protein
MDRKVVDCVRQMREANRLIFGLISSRFRTSRFVAKNRQISLTFRRMQ